jgi:hypothetical protein
MVCLENMCMDTLHKGDNNNNNNNEYSALGPVWQEPEPSHATGTALIRYILGKFLRVVCHCFPPRLEVPTFAASCLHVLNDARDPSSERWNYGREMSGNFAYITSQFTPLWIFYMPHIYGFSSPPKEGLVRIFFPLKIRRLRPGLNLGTKGQHVTPRPPKPLQLTYLR